MSDDIQIYQSDLTGPELDEALRNIGKVQQAVGQAEDAATLAESWAVGGTGDRSGEDTNNAKYWAGQAQAAAGPLTGTTSTVTPQQVYEAVQQGRKCVITSTYTGRSYSNWSLGGAPYVRAGEIDAIEASDVSIRMLTGNYDSNAWESDADTQADVMRTGTDLHLYKTIFYASGWSSSAPYTQRQGITKMDGGPDVTASSIIGSVPMSRQTQDESTNQAFQKALNCINAGWLVLGANTLEAHVFDKPTSDVEVYLLIRKG